MANSNQNSSDNTVKLLIGAVVVGLIAAMLSVLYLKAREQQLRDELTPQVESRSIIVASQDILKGTKLDSSVLSIRDVPAEYVSALALSPDEFSTVEGKVLIQNLRKGNAVLRNSVDETFPLDFSDTIPLKRRAMTIQVDEVNTISGFIRPGNKIDLFALMPSKSVFPVLENVEVLATGKDSAYEYEEKVRMMRGFFPAQPDSNFTTLTINVTPKEAAIVATARDQGDLIALLRNRNDTGGAGFAEVTENDIKSNAAELAVKANIKEAAAAAAGFVMGEDGVLRTKDGVALANQGLIVMADGTIMTKDGVVLSGRGLTVNEKGELVDSKGNVVDPDSLTLAADGSVITKDGTVLAGGKGLGLGGKVKLAAPKGVVMNGMQLDGVTRRADGMLVLEDGSVVDPADVVIGADGVIRTKDGKVLEGVSAKAYKPELVTADGVVIAGLNINKDGKVVMADGTLVDPENLIVGSDGKVYTKDGRLVDATVGVAIEGLKTDANGNVVAGNGVVIQGATLNKDGMLVLPDGTLVDPNDVVIGADGVVRTKDGKILKGLTADTSAIPGLEANTYSVDYIVGGVSKDGVAEINAVPVVEK